ncbi:MAG: hypothetical protein PHD48_06415 [Alphaproteobacteria bacterium]|nr:hypothetical protein [Alphaproteobacteria bacterium]
MKQLRRHILFTALLLLGLSGCTQRSHQDESAKVFPFVRLSPSAPPQAPYEEQPESNAPMQQIWRAGYWDYDGTTFYWVPGHFIYRPDPTAAWTADRWEQRAFGWAFVPGYWQ